MIDEIIRFMIFNIFVHLDLNLNLILDMLIYKKQGSSIGLFDELPALNYVITIVFLLIMM